MIDCLKYFPEINTSYRTEKKIIFDHDVKIWFQKLQKLKKIKYLFPKRIIESVYYDTQDLTCFWNSNEGIIPRFKLRKRKYIMSGIKSKKENIEIKGTFRKGRFKIKGNDKFIFQNNLIPICKINYERNYYSLGRLRITIDQNINYIF